MNDTLAWNTPIAAENVTGFNVYEHIGTNYSKVTPTPLPVATLSFKPSNLSIGSHGFVVTAINATGESPKSNEVIIVVAAPPPQPLPLPSAPTGLRVV